MKNEEEDFDYYYDDDYLFCRVCRALRDARRVVGRHPEEQDLLRRVDEALKFIKAEIDEGFD